MKREHILPRIVSRCGPFVPGLLLAAVSCTAAQAVAQTASTAVSGQDGAVPVKITLDEAIRRAEASEPTYAAAQAESRSAALDRSIARAGMLPTARVFSQAFYTQPGDQPEETGQGAGSRPLPRFIASNAVREYIGQVNIDETFGLDRVAGARRADAASAVAAAGLEIARRGLVAAVTGFYYGVAAADRKQAIAERAKAESDDFVRLTIEREQAREAAHADVVKAQLQQQQRDRELADARLTSEKARLELGVLLFPDPHTPYELAISDQIAPLASRAEVNQAAAGNNPDLKGALANLQISNADVLAARAGYLPSIGLNVTYGIDASQAAFNGPDNAHNLGYSAAASLNIPVWDWLATQHKVRQSQIRREAAQVALSATQRRLIARLDEAYSEAETARSQLVSLDQSVATAAESLRLTRLRYTGGEATVLEVVDAESASVLAENAREDGRLRYRMALASLQTLTGTM